MRFVLFFLMLLLTLAGALAAPTRNDSILTNQTRQEGDTFILEPYNETVRGWGNPFTINNFSLAGFETDEEYRVLISPANQRRLTFRVENVTDTGSLTAPLWVCMNDSAIKRFNNRVVDSTPYCDFGTKYYWEIPLNENFPVDLDKYPERFEWWIGNGAGGGLPICTGLSTGITFNQTNGTVVFDFDYKAVAEYVSYGAGCTATNLVWQYKVGSSFVVVPTTNTSTPLDCKGVNCYQGSPVWSWLYTRSVRCDVPTNLTLRSAFTGTVNGKAKTVYSIQKTVECLNPYVPPTSDEGFGAWWIYAFPFLMLITTIFVVRKKKNAA